MSTEAQAPAESSSSHIAVGGATSGLTINLHPLPILNVSDHLNRSQLTSAGPSKVIGALLGTESNREISIVNSFELILVASDGDVDMGEGSTSASANINPNLLNTTFFETRRDQFKQVFPTLDVVGWYSVGDSPTAEDVTLHQQLTEIIDTPIFLLFHPNHSPASQALPVTIYEAALAEGGKDNSTEGKFVELAYGIETGEAERIAVDGVSRGGMGGEGEEIIANLTTQRNAIRMLYERVAVLLQYITAVINKTAKPDHNILRQVSALVATLPTMDAKEFREELNTEYDDVQLTAYLTTLTKQLNALSEYADKHNLLHPPPNDDFTGPHGGMRGGGRGFSGFDYAGGGGGGRRRR
uniref:COP9 signalosome complex subunit 6 n=1 Tax=Kwoniella bestiolae CBS 10118 TaxID=1296100 RepID=A0A1B9G6Q3_9TREE|nr:COP9 signalosome complex subunit 6 [Kwoniella bestiolae CBS 10118]OCF26708.1 COP9 signalosome complex subunit 6 [Kwoniella bestiolae CBS 10118]